MPSLYAFDGHEQAWRPERPAAALELDEVVSVIHDWTDEALMHLKLEVERLLRGRT